MSFKKTNIYCSFGKLFICRNILHVLCGFNIFLMWAFFWFGYLLSLSSACTSHYPLDKGYASAWPAPTLPARQGSGWLPVWVPQRRQLVAHTLGRKGQWLVLHCGTFSSSDESPRVHPWEGGGRDLHLFTGRLVVAVVCSCPWSLRWQQWLASAPAACEGGALLPKSAQRKMLLWRACPSPCITPNNGVLHLWQVQASSWTPLVWANHTLDILTVFIQSTLMLSSGSDSQSPRIGIQPRPLQWMSL